MQTITTREAMTLLTTFYNDKYNKYERARGITSFIKMLSIRDDFENIKARITKFSEGTQLFVRLSYLADVYFSGTIIEAILKQFYNRKELTTRYFSQIDTIIYLAAESKFAINAYNDATLLLKAQICSNIYNDDESPKILSGEKKRLYRIICTICTKHNVPDDYDEIAKFLSSFADRKMSDYIREVINDGCIPLSVGRPKGAKDSKERKRRLKSELVKEKEKKFKKSLD